MLNFNRIYEQEMLREYESPYANPVIKVGGQELGKTFAQSVLSFISTLPATKQVAIERTTSILADVNYTTPMEEFLNEFERIHKINPELGKARQKKN